MPEDLGQRDLASGASHFDALSEVDAIANGSCMPWREIDARYPGTLFILTLRRDRAAWLRSCERYQALQLEGWLNLAEETRDAKLAIRRFEYGIERFDAEVWSRRYDRRVSEVTAHFRGRPDCLLSFDASAGDGWEKLCPFLGVPEPKIAFPHSNSIEVASVWYQNLRLFWSEVNAVRDMTAPLILVDAGEYNAVKPGEILPFPEQNGAFAGFPENGDELIKNLERLRREGARTIAFTASCFWVFGEYPSFREHLFGSYPVVLTNERSRVFSLD